VVATARRAHSRLEHLKVQGAAILELDVTSSQQELDIKIQEAIEFYGGIDVVINNASYIEAGLVEECTSDGFLSSLSTNLLGSINLTRAVMPHFRAKRSGFNVFIGSVGGWQGEVGAGPYCTSKFALEGLVECLQKETNQFGVKNIIFEPGYFRTKIYAPENLKFDKVNPIHDYIELNKMLKAGISAINGHQPGDPKKAVNCMIDVIKGEGFAKGKTLPARLPLGPDGLEQIRNKCNETLKICNEWEAFVGNTNL